MFLNLGLTLIAIILISSIISGAPFIPSKRRAVGDMVTLANAKTGDKVVDLGAGDGRLLIAFAKIGIEVHGYEINPLLVLWARYQIHKQGLTNLVFIHWRSFWSVNLSGFDIVAVYGIKWIMGRLENKLQKELHSGARVVSNLYAFPTWEPAQKFRSVYLYKR